MSGRHIRACDAVVPQSECGSKRPGSSAITAGTAPTSGAEIAFYVQEPHRRARRGDQSLRRPDVDASASLSVFVRREPFQPRWEARVVSIWIIEHTGSLGVATVDQLASVAEISRVHGLRAGRGQDNQLGTSG